MSNIKSNLNRLSLLGNYQDTLDIYNSKLSISNINMILGILCNHLPELSPKSESCLLEIMTRHDLDHISYECLCKLYQRLNRLDKIYQILSMITQNNIQLKLRGYSAILSLFNSNNKIEESYQLYQSIHSFIDIGETEFSSFLQHTIHKPQYNSIIIHLLLQLSTYIYHFNHHTNQLLYTWCCHNLNETIYIMEFNTITGKSIIKPNQFYLSNILLSNKNRTSLLVSILNILKETKHFNHFKKFSKFIESKKIDIHIDGANVGFYNKRVDKNDQLSYYQIDLVVDYCLQHNYSILLYLHKRHIIPSNQYIQKWSKMKIIYITPTGINDDWYWLYGSMCHPNSKIITNDLMRDHHFNLLSKRIFLQWMDRHVIHFDFLYHNIQRKRFEPPTQIIITFPTLYSQRIQYDKTNNRWYIPIDTIYYQKWLTFSN